MQAQIKTSRRKVRNQMPAKLRRRKYLKGSSFVKLNIFFLNEGGKAALQFCTKFVGEKIRQEFRSDICSGGFLAVLKVTSHHDQIGMIGGTIERASVSQFIASVLIAICAM